MDPVSCLYNFLSLGILSYFVIICFLIKKCCMNCGTKCTDGEENLCKCYQNIYEGEITPSNHVIVRKGDKLVPMSYLLNQENNDKCVLGEDGVLYRNEACRVCCTGDDISRASCNSHQETFIIHADTGPSSPSTVGLGEGSCNIPNQGASRGSLSCGSRKSKQSVDSCAPSGHSGAAASAASSIGPPPSGKMSFSEHKAKSDVSVQASLHKTKSDVTPSIPERRTLITQKPSTSEHSYILGSITPVPSIREPIPKVASKPFVPQPVVQKPIVPVPSVHKSPSPHQIEEEPTPDPYCVTPCGSRRSRSPKKSMISLACGSPGRPCPHKMSKTSQATSVSTSRKSSAGSVCSKSRGSGYSSPKSEVSSATKSKSSCSSGLTSPGSSPASSHRKRGSRCTSTVCCSSSGRAKKNVVGKLPSPILKNDPSFTKQAVAKDGVISPRVSIKEKFDIISPEGITSAPTFGKDCTEQEVSSNADQGSYASSRRNDVLSDEYKDDTSNKRKADNISTDYNESIDTSRGSKSARICKSTSCSSKASSSKSCSKCSKGTKSVATTETRESSATTSKSSRIITSPSKCSKCSSDTISLSTSTKYTNDTSSNAKFNSASVTTADIDDYRVMGPGNSRCENLGVALSKISRAEIRKLRQESTCEAIKDPSKDVICGNDGSNPNAECTAIQNLKNMKIPEVLRMIQAVDEMASAGTAGNAQGGRGQGKGGEGQRRAEGQGRGGEGQRRAEEQGRVVEGQGRGGGAGGGQGAVTLDANVIYEISTKVQCCLEHARSIATKMGEPTECRKTMRVQARSHGQEQSLEVHPNMTLTTKGITINECNKIDKPLSKSPGIQVKMKNSKGSSKQFKKPYSELTAEDGSINIRVRSPCKSTPGKLLCVSTANNPCCSNTTINKTISSTKPATNSQGQPNRVTYQDNSKKESTDESRPESEEYSSQDESPNNKGAVVVYKQSSKPRSSKRECSPECSHCRRKTCPTAKNSKGRKKQGKLQVYNVTTTSHYSQMNRHFNKPPFVKWIPPVDPRMYEQYIYPERYRSGESYSKKRKEMIQKIKNKCPWL